MDWPRGRAPHRSDSFESGVTGVVALLYCGGAKPVSDALTAISKDLGISFRKESFAW